MTARAAARPSSSPSQRLDATVLVVEDDPDLGVVLAAALAARVRTVEVVTTGGAGLEAASILEPDVVVLDLGLPDIDGVEVCRRLRRWFHNPILVLSAEGADVRKVEALDQGANDYVTKPFSMPEFLARIRVALRHRRFVAAVVDGRVLEIGPLRIDTDAHEVTVGDSPMALTPKEYSLLLALARVPGRVVTHGALRVALWGEQAGGIESLRVHVNYLRRKLERAPGAPAVLTEPGVGYRLALPEEQ